MKSLLFVLCVAMTSVAILARALYKILFWERTMATMVSTYKETGVRTSEAATYGRYEANRTNGTVVHYEGDYDHDMIEIFVHPTEDEATRPFSIPYLVLYAISLVMLLIFSGVLVEEFYLLGTT